VEHTGQENVCIVSFFSDSLIFDHVTFCQMSSLILIGCHRHQVHTTDISFLVIHIPKIITLCPLKKKHLHTGVSQLR